MERVVYNILILICISSIVNYALGQLKERNITVSWKLEVDSIEEFGVYVLQRGRSYLKTKGTDGSIRESNVRFFIVWSKTGDSYKVLNDIFTRL
ncbi:MAG TPA: hypothetical protein VGA21_06680 [Cyclobacteriaceae bacterium]|jgi:ketosteroid isomerase-like protein